MICRALGLLIFVGLTQTADILLLATVPSHSHSLWWHSLAKIFLEKGHQVTILDADPPRGTLHPNLTHYEALGGYVLEEEGFLTNLDDLLMMKGTFPSIDLVVDYARVCEPMVKSEGTRKLTEEIKKGKQFDLVMSDWLCESFLRLVPLAGNPPLAMATAYGDTQRILKVAGIHDNPAYVPTQLSSFSHPMSFSERATNLIYSIYETVTWNLFVVKKAEEMATEVFGVGPSIDSIARSAALVFVNTHFATSGSKPLPPNVVPVAGVHIEDVKPLPKDIKAFLDAATDGAIFFSLGSNVQSSFMSPENVKKFVSVFARMKQRVLWKWEKEPPKNLPPNVMLRKWLPQSDILGHKNMKVFISHGGLLSTQESIYRGVPILAMPFMVDQLINSKNIEQLKIGFKLDYKKLKEEDIENYLNTLVSNKEYRGRMEETSRLFKDRPQPARETFAYWVEYILRNKNSLKPLRCGSADLPWYQLLYLDIISTVLAVLYITYVLVKSILRSLSPRPKPSKTKQS